MKKIYNKFKNKYPLLAIAIILLLVGIASYGTVKFFATVTKNDLLAVGTNYERIADPNTMENYLNEDVFGLNKSSRRAGRIWSDKTVFAAGYTNNSGGAFDGTTLTLNKSNDGTDAEIKLNTDFLHVFSAIGSSQVVDQYTTQPLDVVLLLDISTSMTNTNQGNNDPLHEVLDEANVLISQLMGADPDYTVNPLNRVGVVVYGGGAQVLLPLDHYNSSTVTSGKKREYMRISNTDPKAKDSTAYFSRIISTVKEISNPEATKYMYADATYLQGALFEGMNMLANEEDTTYLNKVTDQREPRTPVLITLTDGATNIVSTTSSSNSGNTSYEWWNPFRRVIGTDGNNRYAATATNPFYADCNQNTGYGTTTNDSERASISNRRKEIEMIAARNVSNLLLAGYYQNKIEANYKTDMKNYSIGFNVNGLGEYPTEQLLGTLDPKTYFDEDREIDFSYLENGGGRNHLPAGMNVEGKKAEIKQLAKAQVDKTRELLEEYIAGTKNPELRFPAVGVHKFVGTGYANFTWNHPGKDDPNDVDDFSDIEYIDKYYTTSDDDTIGDIFADIFEQISDSKFNPIDGENDAGVNDSLVYMDPIGEYMEVKDKGVDLNGKTYDLAMTLFEKNYGLVKTAVYDYNFNVSQRNKYPNQPNAQYSNGFLEGWYKTNDDGTAELIGYYEKDESGNTTTYHAVQNIGETPIFEDGYTYYANVATARQYISTLSGEGTDDITTKEKNTFYTMYRIDDNSRNEVVSNPCYEKNANINYKLSDIRVWLEETDDYEDDDSGSVINNEYDNALYINIPKNALPILTANISIDTNNKVNYQMDLEFKKNMSSSNSEHPTPFRLFYGVGVSDEIKSADGLDIDISKLSNEYISSHTINDGIYFLSNWYSNTEYNDTVEVTSDTASLNRGDPNVTFSPARDNRYYSFQKPLVIYKPLVDGDTITKDTEVDLSDEDAYNQFLENHANSVIKNPSTELDPNEWYVIIVDYYVKDDEFGNGRVVHRAVTRKGSEFGVVKDDDGSFLIPGEYLTWYNTADNGKVSSENIRPFDSSHMTAPQEEGNWVLATKVGGLRVGNLAKMFVSKTQNVTESAKTVYVPTISSNTDDENIIVNNYLGNNGRIVIPNKLLQVTKEVESEGGESDPNKEFKFEATINNYVGDHEAIVLIKNPFSGAYQLRLNSIDVVTDNRGLLQTEAYTSNGVEHPRSVTTTRSGGVDYYIYIGGSASEDGGENSYPLFRADSNTGDVENLEGVGRNIYVKPAELSTYESKSTENTKYLAATRNHPAGSIEYWVKEAYLVPKNTADADGWTFDSGTGYQVLKQYVISTLDSNLTGANELSSKYVTRSSYLTRTLYFGYDPTSIPERPENMGADDPNWLWMTNPANKFKAQFTLKDGEGLEFTGIGDNESYSIKEVLTADEEDDGYFFDRVEQEDGTLVNSVEVNGVVNSRQEEHYFNGYRAHYDITLDKTVMGTYGDINKTWEFKIKLTPPTNPDTGEVEEFKEEYSYYGPCTDLESCPKNDNKLTFTDNKDGTYTATVSLKHNEKVKIINILYNTKYEITEVEANQDGYESYTNNEKGYAAATGEFDADKHIGMINANWKRYDLTLRKTVLGSGGSKTRDFTFKVTLTPPSDVRLAESYSYEGSKTGDMKFTKNSNANSYTGTVKLKDSEYITIKGLPENVTYEVVEVEANKNGYVTTIPTNSKGTLDGTEPTIEVHYVNGKYELHDLTLEKIVRGENGDKDKEWTFEVTLEPGAGIIINDKYSYKGSSIINGVEAPKDGEISFKKNDNGSYVGTITLKHGQAITIKDIPENTRYTVREMEANKDGYTTSDSGNTNGIVDDQHVRFTNKMLEKVDLSISKEVKGDNANLDLDWEFEITLIPGADDLNSPYSYVGESFIDGVTAPENGKLDFTDNGDGTYKATITLKHGQKITIKDLSETTKYTVKELGANTDGYFTSSTDNKTGVLGSEDTKVNFTNELLPNSSLTIAKEVLGSAGNKEKDWTFQIDLIPIDSTLFATTYNYKGRAIIDGVDSPDDSTLEFTDEDGDGTYTATITLIHGQAITILDLPIGTNFKISEVEANTDGYRTSINREVTGTIDGETVADIIVFSNIKTINYDLRLGKQVVGTLGDKDKDWLFNIKLIPDEYGVISSFDYDGSKNGTLNFVRQDDGSYLATISLKHNEHITIRGIPENTRYSIEEVESNQGGYITYVLGNATDFLTENGVSVEFVNTKFNDFNLMVKKTVKGSFGDKTKDWNFRIEFVRPEYEELEEQYKYSKSTIDSSGNVVEETGFIEVSPVGNSLNRYEAFITLKHGESLTILGLPEGTDYTVTEDEANQDGYETSMSNNIKGTLVSNEVVEFTNSKYLKYDLTIEKVVTGIGDKNKDWNFDITLTPMNGLLLNNTYNYVGSKTGTITFTKNEDGTYTGRITLKHGESVTIQDLPEDTKYSVTEVEANQDGYETTSQNESGELNKDGIKVVYTNFKEEPPTGGVTPPPHTGVEVGNIKINYIVNTLLLITYLIISIKFLKRV